MILDPAGHYTARDVAAFLRHSLRWFYKHRPRLHAVDNFPAPISSIGQPHWLGETLLAWERRPQTPAIDAAGGNVISYDRVLAARGHAVAKQRRRG